jgi:hypothetical protein
MWTTKNLLICLVRFSCELCVNFYLAFKFLSIDVSSKFEFLGAITMFCGYPALFPLNVNKV